MSKTSFTNTQESKDSFMNKDTLLRNKETDTTMTYQDWLEVYEAKFNLDSYSTLTASQLVQADIILRVLVEVK